MNLSTLPFIAMLLATNIWMASRSQAAMAATLRLVAEHPSISVTVGASTTLKASINLTNSGDSTASLAIWLATLQVIADSAALGEVRFLAAAQPNDYLLKDASPFGPMLVFGGPVPTSTATFSDAAILAESGVLLPAHETSSLFDVELAISPNAIGKFYIVMGPFGEDAMTSSSWSDPITPEMPRAFENGAVGSTIADRTLVEINVISVPEPTALQTIAGMTIAWGFIRAGLSPTGSRLHRSVHAGIE
jgi:hypothetical protein